MSIMSMVGMLEEQPKIRLTDKTLKSVKDWDVGETYTITLKVMMKEKELRDDNSIEGCFCIVKASSGDKE